MSVAAVALLLLASVRVETPLVMSAQAPASNVETVLVPYLGARVAVLDSEGHGMFTGADASLLFGYDAQGTAQVSVVRVPVVLEGRGLVGARFRGGLAGLGAYGYAGGGGGAGVASFTAFDDARSRVFGTWLLRAGGGVEVTFLEQLAWRVELGVGVRDLRPEVHGALGLALIF